MADLGCISLFGHRSKSVGAGLAVRPFCLWHFSTTADAVATNGII